MSRRLSLFVLACALSASDAAGQTPIHRGRSLAPDAAVRVFNLAGTIRVTGWHRDSIDVSAIVPADAGEFYFGGGYAGVKLGVQLPGGSEAYPGSLIEVRVPAGAKVWLKAESAEILITGLTGQADLSTVTGRIVVTGNPTQLMAESMDGGIDAKVTSTLVRLKTAGGAIALRGTVTDVAVSTVSGAATVQADGLDRARMETVSGHLTFDAAPRPGGGYVLESHSGDILLRLPADFDASVELTALGGKVINKLTKRIAKPTNKGSGETLVLSAGDLTAEVVARTFKGTITVEAQTSP